MKLKLNCDLGELTTAANQDALIMPYIDQANIACGFHASDPLTMQNTVALAKAHNVAIGAHPSYADKTNFGRISMALSSSELSAILHYQIGALQALCHAQDTTLSYVKPHGALYNDMMVKQEVFTTICQAIASLDNSLPLMIQAHANNQTQQAIAQSHGITLWREAFADRAYQDNGLLVPRSQPGAVLTNSEQVLDQVQSLAQNQQLTTINQQLLTLNVDTLCVHGDNAEAVNLVKSIRAWLDAHYG